MVSYDSWMERKALERIRLAYVLNGTEGVSSLTERGGSSINFGQLKEGTKEIGEDCSGPGIHQWKPILKRHFDVR